MHTLTRHVLIELLKVFALAVASLTTIILLVCVVREALDRGLPLAWVPLLVPYLIPLALQASLPATLLLATTFVFGRMSGGNEVVALKALGISPWPILRPAYFLAVALSVATFFIYDLAVSWGRTGLERVGTEALEEIAYSTLRTQQCFSCRGLTINIKRLEGRKLRSPTVTIAGVADGPSTTITADEAELRSDPAHGVLKARFRNAKIETPGRLTGIFPGDEEVAIPVRDPSKEGDSVQPSSLPIRLIPGKVEEQQTQIRRYQEAMGAEAACTMIAGEFGELAGPQWDLHALRLHEMHKRLCRLLTEPHRRWAWGFSCFVFVWVGAPMAVWLRNADPLTSFFLCFLPILVVYYPLLLYFADASKNGSLPPWSVWLDNVLLFGFGWALLRQVMRH